MGITLEYLDERFKMKKEQMHKKLKDFDWFDDILDKLKKELENKKRLKQLQKDVEEKKKTLEPMLENAESLKEKLESQKERIVKIEEELENLKCVEEEARKELKEKEERVKNIWKAQRIAMLYYKDRLGIQLKVVDDIITVKFTNISEDEKKKYLVKLTLNVEKWSCVDIFPKFKGREAFIDLLNETNDIQGFLVCIRKKFQEIHKHH